jgi:hypothetical protein
VGVHEARALIAAAQILGIPIIRVPYTGEVTATNYAFSKLRWSMYAALQLRRSKKAKVKIEVY